MQPQQRTLEEVMMDAVRHVVERVNRPASRSVIPRCQVIVQADPEFNAWIQGSDRGVLIVVTSGMAMALVSACVQLSCVSEVTGILGYGPAELSRPDMVRPDGLGSIDAFQPPKVLPGRTPPTGWETNSELLLRALLFVMFHEQGHFVNGDTHYQRGKTGANDAFREEYAAHPSADTAAADHLRKAMEYRADMAASMHSIGIGGFIMTDAIIGRGWRVDGASESDWRQHILRGFAAIAVAQGVIGQLAPAATPKYPSPMLRGMMGFLAARDMLGWRELNPGYDAYYRVLADHVSWMPQAAEVTSRIMILLGTPLTAELMEGFFGSEEGNPIVKELVALKPHLTAADTLLSPCAKAARKELGTETAR